MHGAANNFEGAEAHGFEVFIPLARLQHDHEARGFPPRVSALKELTVRTARNTLIAKDERKWLAAEDFLGLFDGARNVDVDHQPIQDADERLHVFHAFRYD